MTETPIYPRFLQARLEEALTDTPVVLIHGPRQCGKTTLAKQVGDAAGYRYLSFDDDTLRQSAQADPVGFVAELPGKVILDEVQRVPELFTSLKASVDANRRPGRFILTGSANVLLLPKLSDSLAGRMEILRLHPLSQSEIRKKDSRFLEHLFAGTFKAGPSGQRLGKRLAGLMGAGGYPAALVRATARRRSAWYRDYAETLVQRDVRDLGRISALDVMPRLLALAASQSARLINVSELAAPFQLSRPTIRDYMTLFEKVFVVDELPPWHSNRLKRLIKTAKLHLGDTGLACAVLNIDEKTLWDDRALYGQLLETFVYQEVRRQASWQEEPVSFHHYRDKDGAEVDVVLEAQGKLAGIEIKAASTVSTADFKGLQRLREAAGKRFASGVVLYDGEAVLPFGEGLRAVPITALWANA